MAQSALQNDAVSTTTSQRRQRLLSAQPTTRRSQQFDQELRSPINQPPNDLHEILSTKATSLAQRSQRTLRQQRNGGTMMSVQDYVRKGLRDSQDGIEGYFITKINALDKPQVKHIRSGKRTTYIDDAVRSKRDVPSKFYNTMRNLNDKTHKSNLCKAKRTSLMDEIAAHQKKYPAPNRYNPSFDLVRDKHSACLDYKGMRVSFVADAQRKGQEQPEFHNKNHELTEKRAPAAKYREPGKNDAAGPAFLKDTRATKLISPVTYNASDSFFKTQTRGTTRAFSDATVERKEVKKSTQGDRESRSKPGPGHYELKALENAYSKITLGAGRGWK